MERLEQQAMENVEKQIEEESAAKPKDNKGTEEQPMQLSLGDLI